MPCAGLTHIFDVEMSLRRLKTSFFFFSLFVGSEFETDPGRKFVGSACIIIIISVSTS